MLIYKITRPFTCIWHGQKDPTHIKSVQSKVYQNQHFVLNIQVVNQLMGVENQGRDLYNKHLYIHYRDPTKIKEVICTEISGLNTSGDFAYQAQLYLINTEQRSTSCPMSSFPVAASYCMFITHFRAVFNMTILNKTVKCILLKVYIKTKACQWT